MKNIAINGFGRIGRAAFKIALEHHNDLKIVAINDLFDTKTLAYLLKYDSVYGTYQKKVDFDQNNLIIDQKKYPVFSEKNPANLPWKKLNVDTVIESTGIFRKKEDMELHLKAGAKKVMLSAPPKSKGVSTHVLSVSDITADKNVLKSCASCTTNSIAPPIKVIHDHFSIQKALLTTIHGYTADQNLIDSPHKKDFRRGRAAAENIIPTTTGAAIATTQVIPDLKNRFDGIALRVPTPAGSVSDITMLIKKKTTVEKINQALEKASKRKKYQGILSITRNPIVSRDVLGTNYSSIVDLNMTKVIDGNLVKILSWYDNEWGYTSRLVEAIIKT